MSHGSVMAIGWGNTLPETNSWNVPFLGTVNKALFQSQAHMLVLGSVLLVTYLLTFGNPWAVSSRFFQERQVELRKNWTQLACNRYLFSASHVLVVVASVSVYLVMFFCVFFFGGESGSPFWIFLRDLRSVDLQKRDHEMKCCMAIGKGHALSWTGDLRDFHVEVPY